MVYKTESKMGITIEIGVFRKSVGGKRDGRSNSTGKKAQVTEEGKEPVIREGATLKELTRKIRKEFKIPPSVTINPSGTTNI